MLSISIHVLVLFLLGLIVYTVPNGSGNGVGIIATWMTPQDITRAQEDAQRFLKPVEIAAANSITNGTSSTPSKTTTVNAGTGETAPAAASVAVKPVPVAGALNGRTAETKQSLLQLFGGTKQSEDAVGRGLNWLVRHQKADGRWELHQGYDNPCRINLRTDTGATALALLALLGAGNTHQEGKYKEQVAKGLGWLKKVQKSDGNFHDWEELGRQTAFYSHGQATIVMAESYALTHDSSLQEPLRKALKFIIQSQNEAGGWQYQPGAVGDLSVTGWQVMALQSARMAGEEVPEDVWFKVGQFLDSVSSQDGSRYRYKAADPQDLFTPAMTAEGLLCRQYLGWPREHPALQAGVNWLLEPENLPSFKPRRRNLYHWYYASQVLHHMEGDAWKTWNTTLRDDLIALQLKTGKLGGSWHPHKPEGNDHEYATSGGRLYVTCLALLNLEVYYRHLPLYRQTADPASP